MSKVIKILTPDNVEIEYSLASVGVRAAAAGIDFLLHLLVLLIAGSAAAWFLFYSGADENKVYTTIGIMLIIFGLLNYAYFVACDMLMKGQTIGKRIYHIRVIRDNGEGIAFSHAMIREFFRSAIDPLGIGFIAIFFSKKNKRIGDMVASTIVVEEEKRTLSILDLPTDTGINNYQLSKEELSLLRDYFSRIDDFKLEAKNEMEAKMTTYFIKRFNILDQVTDKERFLRSLL